MNMEIVLITGMSGSGKSVALHSLEDAGYYCVDNLPAELLPEFVRLLQNGESAPSKIAVVIDARNLGHMVDRAERAPSDAASLADAIDAKSPYTGGHCERVPQLAILLADRVVMMTNGPRATIGKITQVNLPRPRTRKSLLSHPDYYNYRKEIIDFLEKHELGQMKEAA